MQSVEKDRTKEKGRADVLGDKRSPRLVLPRYYNGQRSSKMAYLNCLVDTSYIVESVFGHGAMGQ